MSDGEPIRVFLRDGETVYAARDIAALRSQRPVFACEFCTAEYVTPLAASLCCDKEYDKDDDQY